jgi:hypothetical protein
MAAPDENGFEPQGIMPVLRVADQETDGDTLAFAEDVSS